jgi:hypothetical protein
VLVIAALVIGSSLPYKALIAVQDAPQDNGPELSIGDEAL